MFAGIRLIHADRANSMLVISVAFTFRLSAPVKGALPKRSPVVGEGTVMGSCVIKGRACTVSAEDGTAWTPESEPGSRVRGNAGLFFLAKRTNVSLYCGYGNHHSTKRNSPLHRKLSSP